MVAERRAGHAVADGGHDPGAFVTEHHGSRVLPLTEHDMQIGVTHAGGGDGHLDLAGLRRGELHVGDPHWLARGTEQRGSDPAAPGHWPVRREGHPLVCLPHVTVCASSVVTG